ncbi:MAG: hypothetical protein EXS42_08285 [Lacunisphaera sp.]|nr:hypothetical protein [Lacunisphaera sp.]
MAGHETLRRVSCRFRRGPQPVITLYVFFRFGCHEAKFISETQTFAADLNTVDFRLITDLNNISLEELRSLLAAYRKERPARTIVSSGGQAAKPAEV